MEQVLYSPRRLLKATKIARRVWEVRNSGNFHVILQNIKASKVPEALARLEAQR